MVNLQNPEPKDEWFLVDKQTLLMKFAIDELPELRNKGIKFDTLPEIFRAYMSRPKLFDSKRMEQINIHTDSAEILGYDKQGKVFGKDEKLIIHTHGVFIKSKQASELSMEDIILSDNEFSMLLEGKIPRYMGGNSKIKVYKENQIISGIHSGIKFPCINILRADKYVKDPCQYCNELEYAESVKGFERNALLISRTMQEPEKLMKFIKEDVHYFCQVSPLIEPIIFSGVEKLFRKYENRVMPLILGDGEIIKEASDAVDFFNGAKSKRFTYFSATINIKRKEKN
jgi:hypothetical protein